MYTGSTAEGGRKKERNKERERERERERIRHENIRSARETKHFCAIRTRGKTVETALARREPVRLFPGQPSRRNERWYQQIEAKNLQKGTNKPTSGKLKHDLFLVRTEKPDSQIYQLQRNKTNSLLAFSTNVARRAVALNLSVQDGARVVDDSGRVTRTREAVRHSSARRVAIETVRARLALVPCTIQVRLVSAKAERPNHPSCGGGGVSQPGGVP